MNKLIVILAGLFLLSVSIVNGLNSTTTPMTTSTARLNLTTSAHIHEHESTNSIVQTTTHVSKGVQHHPVEQHLDHEVQAKEMSKTLDNHNFSSKLTFNLFSIIAVVIVHLL